MTDLAILIDFGSTFTKVCAVDLAQARVIGRAQSPSTVNTDVREGLLRGLQSLHERHGIFDRKPVDLTVLDGVKVLAFGSLTKKLTVRANKFSKAAAEAITSKGGEAVTL